VALRNCKLFKDSIYRAIFEPIDREDLPDHWHTYPAPRSFARVGNAWLAAKSSMLLFVPSVVDPLAQIVLFNPLHEEAIELKLVSQFQFTYDERFFKM